MLLKKEKEKKKLYTYESFPMHFYFWKSYFSAEDTDRVLWVQ